MADENEITLATVLQHMQAMELRIMRQLGGQINEVKNNLLRLEEKVDRNHASLTRQIDVLDQRLDVIEIEHLPRRVAKLEQAVGIGQ